MYWNVMYHPYEVGARVQVIQTAYQGKVGTITYVSPENAFSGEAALYHVTFDGATEACSHVFSNWELEPEEG